MAGLYENLPDQQCTDQALPTQPDSTIVLLTLLSFSLHRRIVPTLSSKVQISTEAASELFWAVTKSFDHSSQPCDC
jgi:hypothetical protein